MKRLSAVATRVGRLLIPIAVGLAGAWLAMAAFGSRSVEMGPFTVELSSGFGSSETSISLPPLGSVSANTHIAPLHLSATLTGVDVTRLGEDLQGDTRSLTRRVEADARSHLRGFVLQILAVALAGALLLGGMSFRRDLRAVVVAVIGCLIVVGGSVGLAWKGWRPEAFRQPTFSGSLVLAPQLIGSVEQVSDRVEAFRRELTRVVSSAVRAYTGLEANAFRDPDEIRVLHISDIHLSPLGFDLTRELIKGFQIDLVVDTGDLTSYGTPLEERVIDRIPQLGVPYLFVRGNHDPPALQSAIAGLPNGLVADGDVVEVEGLRVYGLAHPAFTEDKEQDIDHPRFVELATGAAARIASDLEELDRPPDILAVHDERMARALAGRVPLVISGHQHTTTTSTSRGTLFLRVGTTGGSGVNLLSEPGGVPLSAQILYFRPDGRLAAYDQIAQSPTTGSLTIERRLADDPALEPSPSPSS